MNRIPNALVALLALASVASADVVTLEASGDNTLYNDPSGGLSNGSGETFFVGRMSDLMPAPLRRGLVAFDLTSIPPGSTINSVFLTMSMSQAATGNNQFLTIHRVFEDWGEGASNAPGDESAGAAAQAGDATWLHTFFSGSSWTTPGGEFAVSNAHFAAVSVPGFYTWGSTPIMEAQVTSWVNDPSQNFGWIVRGNENEESTYKRFDSREHPDPAKRPMLVIDFTPPGPITYCTSKTTSSGCVPAISFAGSPSASAGSGFLITTAQVEPGNLGIYFYGQSGQAAIAFQGAFLCVQPPTLRTPATSSGPGGACGGTYSIDFNDYIVNGSDASLIAGAVVNLQTWFRDPPNPLAGTGLSDGIEFTIAP